MHQIIQHTPTLQKFAKMGLITLHSDTGMKIGKNTIHYIYEVINNSFEYKGYRYSEEYMSGCFMPYLKCTKI